MSTTTGEPRPYYFPYTETVANTYTIPSYLGIISAVPTANGTYTLPAMSAVKYGAWLWIQNLSAFQITLTPAGTDTINGASSYIIGANSMCQTYTGKTQWHGQIYSIPAAGTSTNTASGQNALAAVSTGTHDSAFGYQALKADTSGSDNSGFGYQALDGTTGGSGNTGVGSGAGKTNTTGANNTFVGFGADAASAALSNAMAIGEGAVVNVSNAAVFGAGSTTTPITFSFTGYNTNMGAQNSITNFTASGTATAANLTTGAITATGAGAITITLDSTANLINTLFQGTAGTAPAALVGSIFKVVVINQNTAAGGLTLAAGDASTTWANGTAPVIVAGTAASPVCRDLFFRLATATTIAIS